MKRILLTLWGVMMLVAACSSGDDEPQTTSQAKQILDRASTVSERPVSKQELMGLFASAGLDAEEKAATRISNNMEAALPEQPVDHFMLGVDGEGMIAFEFASVEAAQKMDAAHDKGFRYRNWYFGGVVSRGVTNQMKGALQ